MSVKIFQCERCHTNCEFIELQPYPPNRQDAYGVGWKCPVCGYSALDVCNLGPVVPTVASCLNCGEEFENNDDPCPGCGLTKLQADAFLRVPATVDPQAVFSIPNLFKQGLFQHGVALLNRLLQQDMRLENAWFLKANFYGSLKFHQITQTMFDQARAKGAPDDLQFQYGIILARSGFDDRAINAIQFYLHTALPQDPMAAAIAYSELGNALTRQQDFKAAEKAHQQAIAALPTFAVLYLNYGDMLIKQRRWKDALLSINAGLQQAKTTEEKTDLLEAKSSVLAGQMRGEEALICIKEVLALGVNSVRAHYTHGRILALLGELEEAQQAMKRALALDPNNASAQQALQQINEALRQ